MVCSALHPSLGHLSERGKMKSVKSPNLMAWAALQVLGVPVYRTQGRVSSHLHAVHDLPHPFPHCHLCAG